MNDEFNAIQKKLAFDTVTLAKKIVTAIDAYASSFGRAESLSFFAANNNLEEYEERYLRFTLELTDTVSELSTLNAKLASLLIAADKAMEIDLTLFLQKRFDAFVLFEQALYEYTSSVESAFSSGTASARFLINSVQRLKSATERLIQENF